MTLSEWVMFVTNIGIFGGYLFVAAAVAPHFKLRYRATRWAGVWFFLTCGLTHAEFALHTADQSGMPMPELTSWHMLTIHAVQVVAIWVFVLGLYRELVVDERDRIPVQSGRARRSFAIFERLGAYKLTGAWIGATMLAMLAVEYF